MSNWLRYKRALPEPAEMRCINPEDAFERIYNALRESRRLGKDWYKKETILPYEDFIRKPSGITDDMLEYTCWGRPGSARWKMLGVD